MSYLVNDQHSRQYGSLLYYSNIGKHMQQPLLMKSARCFDLPAGSAWLFVAGRPAVGCKCIVSMQMVFGCRVHRHENVSHWSIWQQSAAQDEHTHMRARMYTSIDVMTGRAPGRGQNCGSCIFALVWCEPRRQLTMTKLVVYTMWQRQGAVRSLKTIGRHRALCVEPVQRGSQSCLTWPVDSVHYFQLRRGQMGFEVVL